MPFLEPDNLGQMKQGKPTQQPELRCSVCGQTTPSYDIVHCGSLEQGYRQLCSQCFNREVAEVAGLDKFEPVTLRPVSLTDCTGEVHEFHFRIRLLGPEVALDAFELREGQPAGYQFQMIGNHDDDLLALLGRLIERMRRALSTKHLVSGQLGLEIADDLVRGRIEWDHANEGAPMLIIDGLEVTWEQFGRMLTSFEGWQFQLHIRDKSEEA